MHHKFKLKLLFILLARKAGGRGTGNCVVYSILNFRTTSYQCQPTWLGSASVSLHGWVLPVRWHSRFFFAIKGNMLTYPKSLQLWPQCLLCTLQYHTVLYTTRLFHYSWEEYIPQKTTELLNVALKLNMLDHNFVAGNRCLCHYLTLAIAANNKIIT